MSKSSKILVTGSPGAGKSFVSSFFGAVDMDRFGSLVDGKWVIDPLKLPSSSRFYSGISDNIFEVAKFLKPSMIIVVTAPPSFMRKTAGAKLRDLPPEAEAFRETFRIRTTLTNKQLKTEVNSLIKELSKVAPVWELRNPGSDVVKHGWHKLS